MYGKMNGKKTKYYSGNAVNKTPKAFDKYAVDSLLNVPGSIKKLPASGIDFMPYETGVNRIERAGTSAAKKLKGLTKKNIRGKY